MIVLERYAFYEFAPKGIKPADRRGWSRAHDYVGLSGRQRPSKYAIHNIASKLVTADDLADATWNLQHG